MYLEIQDRQQEYNSWYPSVFPDSIQAVQPSTGVDVLPAHGVPLTKRVDRGRKYAAAYPPAISGQGGHNHMLKLACRLVEGFDIPSKDALIIIQEWNKTLDEKWSEKELLHKIDDAEKKAVSRGYMLNPSRNNGSKSRRSRSKATKARKSKKSERLSQPWQNVEVLKLHVRQIILEKYDAKSTTSSCERDEDKKLICFILKFKKPDGDVIAVRLKRNTYGWWQIVLASPKKTASSPAVKLEPIITNCSKIPYKNEDGEEKDGEEKVKIHPLSMQEIILNTKKATDDWPRRAGERLFVHKNGSPDVDLIEKPSEMFGWFGSEVGTPPEFYKRTGFHKESEFFSEFKRTATRYDHIETKPHWPPFNTHYYCCEIPKPGDGLLFEQLLDRFSPATQLDRDLIKLLFCSAFWGGPPGHRPAFLISADSGRGCGKSALIFILGLLVGGIVDISPGEDIECIKKRLLSKDGVTLRVVLLDNLKSHKFSWGEFESLITSPIVSGWLMYIGNGSRPNNCLWCITQNGIGLSTDMAQRCVIIQLARPEYQGDWIEETQDFVTKNQDGIIADIIGFLQAEKNPLANQTRWGAWESQILAGLDNPDQVQKLILDRQQSADSESDECEITEDFFRQQIEAVYNDLDAEIVFIPSQLAASWFNLAHSEHQRTGTVSRILNQAIREGKYKCLNLGTTRRKSRGFLWVGKDAPPNKSISYDLETRIMESKKITYTTDVA